jgi:hypothetical protein
MARRLDEIFIEVTARTKGAKERLEALGKQAAKVQEKLDTQKKDLRESIKLREKYDAANKAEKKAIREQLKASGEVLHRNKTLLKVGKELLSDVEKYSKWLKEMGKDKGNLADDKQVTRLEHLTEYVKLARAEQQDYYEFLKRAGMENARFADKLDKRDRTRNTFENLRRGMDKGAAISMRFHAEESSIYRLERSIGIASSAFDKARHPAEALTDAFYRFQRIGYAMQTVLGVVGGTIGDLVGGLLALVGVAGAAAGSLVAVAGAFANLGAGMMAAKFAFSGIGGAVQKLWQGQNQYNRVLADAKKRLRDLRFEAEDAALSEQEAAIALEKARENLARVQDLPADSRARREGELEYERAELNYRRAKARTKDANAELKRGPKSNAAQNPFNNLTKSQIAFAKYLATLKPVVQSLKEAAASSFLPPLQKSIQVMVDNLVPALKDGLHGLGDALGDASRNFTDAFKDKKNIQLFREFLKNSEPTIRILGAVANKAFGGILVVLRAAQPITNRFVRWVFSVADGFEKWTKSGGEDKLKKFFKLAGDVASELGKGFKLLFGGLSNIVKATFPSGANSGAGGVILQWLKEIGAGFKIFTSSSGFSDWLKGATENAKVALGTIGQFLKVFVDMAASKDNQQFWLIIRDSVPYVKKILEDGQKAGPALANFLNTFVKFISLISESTAINIFFNTLTGIVSTFNAVVQSIRPVLNLFGMAHGAFLAFALVAVLLRKGIQIFMGIMMKLLRVAGAVQTSFTKMRGAFVAVDSEGNVVRKSFNDMRKDLMALRVEATNLKRIEFLKELAKSDKQKQISAIRQKMEALRASGKATKKSMGELQKEIDELNKSYNRLKTNLREGAKDAKTFTQLLDQQKVKADAATFSLDKYARSQDRMRMGGRMARGAGMMALGVASTAATLQGGGGSLLGSGLQLAGGALSFMPGPMMFAGMGLSIVGSIVDGFAQANKEAEQAKEQKKIEIKAKLAEIKAEKLNEKRTALGSLVGRGQDLATANKTFTNLQTAAKTSLTKLNDAQGTDTDKLVSSLLTSDVLANATISGTTRDAIIKAATTAAASGVYSVTDATTEATTINYDAIQTALEAAFTGADGQGKGIAGVKAFQSRVAKTRFTTEGDVTNAERAIAIEKAKVNETKLATVIGYLRKSITAYKDTTYSDKNPFVLMGENEYSDKAKSAAAKDLGITVQKLVSISRQELVDLMTAKLNENLALTKPETFLPNQSKPSLIPDANEIAFRRAMSNAMKPSNKDELPKPTTTFYDKSLDNNKSMLDILKEIRDNLKPPTTSTTYGPFLNGVIP